MNLRWYIDRHIAATLFSDKKKGSPRLPFLLLLADGLQPEALHQGLLLHCQFVQHQTGVGHFLDPFIVGVGDLGDPVDVGGDFGTGRLLLLLKAQWLN